MVNTPVFLTSAVATSAMLPRIFEQTLFLSSHAVARASQMPPLLIARAVVAFFMGAMVKMCVD